MKNNCTLVVAGAGILVAACGGGGGSSGSSELSQITYGARTFQFLLQVDVAQSPSVDGPVSSYSIAPMLPAGLALDGATGVITGTPLATSPYVSYIVTATGAMTVAEAELVIGVDLPPRFAYVANQADDTISVYVIDPSTGRLEFNGFETAPIGETVPEAAVLHPGGEFLYVPNLGNLVDGPTISTYGIGPSDGTLEPLAPTTVDPGRHAMAITPDGEYAYVMSFQSEMISVFDVDPSTGSLLDLELGVSTGSGPNGVAVDPLGRFVYVTNGASGSISAFRIDPLTGALSQSGLPTPVTGIPVHIDFDPSGEHAYVAADGTNTLHAFTVDPGTGELTAMATILPTGQAPTHLAVHPSGRFAYVTCVTGNSVSIYSLDPVSGALSSGGSVATGDEPRSLSIDGSGLFAYVTNSGSNDVSVFTIDLDTGALQDAGRFRTRDLPLSVALTRGTTPVRKRAQYLYVVNSETNDVTGYSVDAATGGLTEIGPPALAGTHSRDLLVEPTGRFAYVINASGGNITAYIITPGTGELVQFGAWPLLGKPRSISMCPSGRYLYVTVRGVNTAVAFELDPVTGILTQTDVVGVGQDPNGIAVDPTGRFVMVSAIESDDIRSFRVERGTFVAAVNTVSTPGWPLRMRFSPRGDYLYVALNSASALVPLAIDASTGAISIVPPGTPAGPRPIIVEPHGNGRFAYCTVSALPAGTGYLTRLTVNEATGKLTANGNFTAGTNPRDARIDPSGRFLYVTNHTSNDVSVFQIDPITGGLSNEVRVATGIEPWSIAFQTVYE